MNDNEELGVLLRAAQAGEVGASETLLGHLRARARNYADFLLRGQLGARADASDLAQEAFVRIGDGFNPAAFPSVPHLLAWLNTTVRNAVIDLRRYHAARVRDDGREVAGGELFAGLASDTTGPDVRVERADEAAQRLSRVEEALQVLPANQRSVFLLRLREDLSFEEVATRVGVTVNHARVLLLRATERLRELLGDQT